MSKMTKSYKIAYMGILFGMSVALSFLEGLVPLTSVLPVGVKLGLSNVVTMYTLFFLGAPQAFLIAFLKSLFVFLMRGFNASLMSFMGGILSVAIMSLLLKIFKVKSYFVLSIFGAVTHNLGQLLMSTLVLLNLKVLYYFPALFLSGIVMGVLTAFVLKIILPYIKKFFKLDIM